MERKYTIKSQAFAPYKKYNAILEAQTNAAKYIVDSDNHLFVYDDRTARTSMKLVLNALDATTYIKRNAHAHLNTDYRVVFMAEGKDYTTEVDTTFDTIEVRSISGKVALRYKIVEIENFN